MVGAAENEIAINIIAALGIDTNLFMNAIRNPAGDIGPHRDGGVNLPPSLLRF